MRRERERGPKQPNSLGTPNKKPRDDKPPLAFDRPFDKRVEEERHKSREEEEEEEEEEEVTQ